MNWYGEAVLLRTFGEELPWDLKPVNLPSWLERHLGKIYLVSKIDEMVLCGNVSGAVRLMKGHARRDFLRSVECAGRVNGEDTNLYPGGVEAYVHDAALGAFHERYKNMLHEGGSKLMQEWDEAFKREE